MSWRDLMCGELRPEHVGRTLTLAGWTEVGPMPAPEVGADGLVFTDRRTVVALTVLSPEVTRQVLRAVAHGDLERGADSGLSSREMEVLACLAQGKTTAQIAAELFISENTVKTHVRHILEKLEASNRAEAVSKATQMGLIGGE